MWYSIVPLSRAAITFSYFSILESPPPPEEGEEDPHLFSGGQLLPARRTSLTESFFHSLGDIATSDRLFGLPFSVSPPFPPPFKRSSLFWPSFLSLPPTYSFLLRSDTTAHCRSSFPFCWRLSCLRGLDHFFVTLLFRPLNGCVFVVTIRPGPTPRPFSLGRPVASFPLLSALSLGIHAGGRGSWKSCTEGDVSFPCSTKVSHTVPLGNPKASFPSEGHVLPFSLRYKDARTVKTAFRAQEKRLFSFDEGSLLIP